MKLIKDTKTSLLLKSFLLNNQNYLSISVLYYFDLNDPEIPLTEQDMYKESSKLLGKTLLDYATPKPKAEVLLFGSCFNPFENEGSSHVRLSVGTIQREFYVFGEREFKGGGVLAPKPFKRMPLDLAHAISKDENHLPNVEDPKHPNKPASFMPKDIFSKKNMKKLGTYDEKWKRELWPGFASDMDYSFFNLADETQQQEKFFEGGESIELLNMHPHDHTIKSYIPKTSMRCLVTKAQKEKADELSEVKLQRDTLWLFPEIQRGIVIFRGTIAVADEIYSDVKSINLKSVKPNEATKSLEEIFELQKEKAKRDVELDETALREADKKIRESQKELFDIPRQTRESLSKAQGKRPSFKTTNHDDESLDPIMATVLEEMQKLKNNPNIPDEQKSKIDISALEPKVKTWNDYAFEFLCDSVVELKKEPEELERLKHLGLAKRTLERSWIGVNNNARTLQGVELPKGLVTPRFFEDSLKSLRVDGKLVLGSDENYELFLSEGQYDFPLFYLKDDVEAHLCDQEVFDICNTLVCDDISKIGDDAKEALSSASVVFYLQKDGVIEKLENAKEFDCGKYKNLFELYQNEIEIREQLVKNLSDAQKENLEIERDISHKAIDAKTKEIQEEFAAEKKAKDDALQKEIDAQVDAGLSKINESLKKNGLDPIDLNAEVKKSITAADISMSFDKVIDALKKQEEHGGADLKESIAQLQKAKDEEIFHIEVEEKEEKIEPKEISLNEKLTREEVIELYKDGESFYAKDLSELDLSNLDLSGIDLSQANLSKTNFQNSKLCNAKLIQANCMETDFTKVDLSEVDASSCVFNKSIFQDTICNNFEAKYAYFKDLVCKECKFKDAMLDKSNFEKVEIVSSSFESCSYVNTSFSKTKIKKSSFVNSNLSKVTFSNSTLNDSEFMQLESKGMMFSKTAVENCNFSDSKLYNMRILKESSFSKCNMSRSNMDKSTIMEASLEECNFSRITFQKVLVKKAELNKCDFTGAIAKGGRFEFSKASECLFVGIDLLKGSLRRMEMANCDFSHSNLYGVEMYKLKLFNVKLDNANLKRSSLEGRKEFLDD